MKISVIVPVADRDAYRTCRASILRSIELSPKDQCEWEVVEVFDDERRGVAWARNEGLSRAAGEYVAWVDSDDEVAEDWAKTILEGIGGRPDVLSFNARVVWQDSSRPGYPVGGAANAADVMAERSIGQLWNKVIRRELFAGLQFKGAIHEDYRLLCELLPKASVVKHVDKSIYVYRRHDRGLSQHVDMEGSISALADLIGACESLQGKWRKEMRKGVAQRIADFCRNSHGASGLRRFVRRSLFGILTDTRLSLRVKAKCAIVAFGLD